MAISLAAVSVKIGDPAAGESESGSFQPCSRSVRSFQPGSFRPDFPVSRFGPTRAGRFGPVSKVGRFGPI